MWFVIFLQETGGASDKFPSFCFKTCVQQTYNSDSSNLNVRILHLHLCGSFVNHVGIDSSFRPSSCCKNYVKAVECIPALARCLIIDMLMLNYS